MTEEKRRGKRGGKAAKLKKQAALEAKIPATPAKPSPAPQQQASQPTHAASAGAEAVAKKRRGKRGGKQAKEKEKQIQMPRHEAPRSTDPGRFRERTSDRGNYSTGHAGSYAEQPGEQEVYHEEYKEQAYEEQPAYRHGGKGGSSDAKPFMKAPSFNHEQSQDYRQEISHDTAEHGRPEGDKKNRGSRFTPEYAIFGGLPVEVAEYFNHVEKMLQSEEMEDSEEDRALMIQNIYKEVEGKELMLATDPDTSRILEKLLRASNDFQIRLFADRLNGQFTLLLRHRFASHVVQTLMYLGSDIVEREATGKSTVQPVGDADVGELPTMKEFFIGLCEQLQGDWVALMTDPFGSHLIRALLNLLSGEALVDNEAELRSNKSKKYNQRHNNAWSERPQHQARQRVVPREFYDKLKDISEHVADSLPEKELQELAVHPVANPVLQLLISVDGVSEKLIGRLLGYGDSTPRGDKVQFVEDLIRHQIGSHLMEKILKVASVEVYQHLYSTYFRGSVEELSKDPLANFVVQQLISSVKNTAQLESLLDELLGSFDRLIFGNRSGVVVKLLESCVSQNSGYKEIIKAITSAFDCKTTDQRKQFVPLLLHMLRYPAFADPSTPRKYQIQGALFLQKLLEFPEEHNKIVIDSLLAVPTDEIFKWMFDPIASRVLDMVFAGAMVSIKVKRKLIFALEGKYGEIAKDKYGSRIIDKIWLVSDINLKKKIAEELLFHEKTLADNFHGKFVLRNCKIDRYKKDQEEWAERQEGVERKKDLMKDFFEDKAFQKKAPGASNVAQVQVAEQEAGRYKGTMELLGYSASEPAAAAKPKKEKGKRKTDNNTGIDGSSRT
ncbi:armadillo-type protein [Polychytrium aggregatum]|uniref:armadillo-type protein n=1 Tax=Polychytrium aggregatum TaxID=110093 RepID=UPI0022FF149B|nr:armadillo-type protein [Polychytrium aggregatum]KAI9203888.1 armadillo-type protein [Polychytrium aggregatum]